MSSQPLGEIADIVRGISFPKDAKSLVPREGDVACLRTTNVQRDVEWDDLWFLPAEHVKRPDQFVQPGDILISTANSYELVGKVALVSAMPRQATLGAFISLIRPRPGVDPKYLYHQLAWGRTQSRIRETASTTTNISNVSSKKLAALELDLPLLDEQRRVVAELEKQFSRLDEAVANLKRVTVTLKRYWDAVLAAAVDGSIIGEPPTAAIPIGSTIEMLDQGWSPQCESGPANRLQDWAVIKTTAIQPMAFLPDENKRLPQALEARPGLELRAGDLLVTRAGPRSRVGVACAVRSTRPRLMLCDKAYRMRFNAAVADARYVEIVLNAPMVRDAIDELKTGISDSGVNLTQKRFRELRIPVPSLARQSQVVAEVDRRLSIIREVEAEVDANLKRAQALRQAVLTSTLSGGRGA